MPVWSFLCAGQAATSISDVVLFENVNSAKNVKVTRWHEILLPPIAKPFYLVWGQKNVHLTWKEVSRGDMVAPYGGLMRWLQSRTTKQTWNFLSVNYKLSKTPRRDQCDLNVCHFCSEIESFSRFCDKIPMKIGFRWVVGGAANAHQVPMLVTTCYQCHALSDTTKQNIAIKSSKL